MSNPSTIFRAAADDICDLTLPATDFNSDVAAGVWRVKRDAVQAIVARASSKAVGRPWGLFAGTTILGLAMFASGFFWGYVFSGLRHDEPAVAKPVYQSRVTGKRREIVFRPKAPPDAQPLPVRVFAPVELLETGEMTDLQEAEQRDVRGLIECTGTVFNVGDVIEGGRCAAYILTHPWSDRVFDLALYLPYEVAIKLNKGDRVAVKAEIVGVTGRYVEADLLVLTVSR